MPLGNTLYTHSATYAIVYPVNRMKSQWLSSESDPWTSWTHSTDSVVCMEVVLYIPPTKAPVRTQWTCEWFLSCMGAQVLVKIWLIPSLIWAMGTGKWLLSRVCSAVLYKVTTVYSPVTTIGTLIQSWQLSAEGEVILNSHRSSTACQFIGIIQQHLQEMCILIIKKNPLLNGWGRQRCMASLHLSSFDKYKPCC